MNQERTPCGSQPCHCLHPELLPEGMTNSCSPIHCQFGLSYASYLVVPRVLLQSMPRDWQLRLIALLWEMDDRFGHHPDNYRVELRDEAGKLMRDDLADYERGRRIIPAKDD